MSRCNCPRCAAARAEHTARDQRLARALELLVEMRGTVGTPGGDGVLVAADYPAEHWSRPEADQRAWVVANPMVYAEPGSADDLAAAIERAHSQWKESER